MATEKWKEEKQEIKAPAQKETGTSCICEGEILDEISHKCDNNDPEPMPATAVVFYQEKPGDSSVVLWLRTLNDTNPKAFDKCRAAISRLALLGHELRRPEADYLRDDIYELRIRLGSVNYRLLYFFHGRTISVVAHGLTKESGVPSIDIKKAIARKVAFTADPASHTFKGEINDA